MMEFVKGLKTDNRKWELAGRIHSDELASLTSEEGLDQMRRLYAEFSSLLEQTAKLFEPERKIFLTQFQERLRRLSRKD